MSQMRSDADSDPDHWRTALGSIGSFARRARDGVATRAEELTVPLAQGDPELGEEESQWQSWARQAAARVRQQTAEAAEQAQRGIRDVHEKAKSVDWGEHVEGVRTNVSRGWDRVRDDTQSATATIQDRVSTGLERAKSVELAEQAKALHHGVSRSFENVAESTASARSTAAEALQNRTLEAQQMARNLSDTQAVQKAREGASAVAGATRGALNVASERASGVAALAMSPATLAQFIAVFFVGTLFIMLSLNFLPILVIAPQKFALLFTFGSVTMLSSFVVLNGFRAFAASLAQRDRLPFSAGYIVGLVGTLWSTIIMRSYIFTAIFAIIQALTLLYFVVSYLPGGRSGLNMIFRLGGRSARSLISV